MEINETKEKHTKPTGENLDQVRLLAPDLRDGKNYPRSPRETLAGYVLAARALDKCRAVLAGTQGKYHSNCPLDPSTSSTSLSVTTSDG